MRRALIAGFVLAVLIALFAVFHNQAQITAWATAMQRDAQNGLARSLQALRSGHAGAWTQLMAVCFGYGFFHAVVPGHGKFLVGAYSTSRDVGLGRLAFATVAASLGQAVTALALVMAGIGAFALTRQQLTALAETTLAQFSLISIMLIGLWLVTRGGIRSAGLLAGRTRPHAHHHDGHGSCDHCGHAHAPTPGQIANAANWRELCAVILAIAIRPCSGAILLLVLTWQMGILPAGIAGVFAMASGTASLTLGVALTGNALRRGAFGSLAESALLRAMGSLIELAAGLAIIVIAGSGLGLF